MAERRYREKEVRRIFELATRPGAPDARTTSAADGLTLEEIQSVAAEVGVSADAIAHAAASLETQPPRARTSLGVPIEVGRTTSLPRGLTDDEWETLLTELRSTFRARGRVLSQGRTREWANGNLHAVIEPTETGYRLRLGTLKGNANGMNALGVVGIVGGAFLLGSAVLAGAGDLANDAMPALLLGGSGIGALIANRIRLPRWRQQRSEQLQHIEAKVLAMTSKPSS